MMRATHTNQLSFYMLPILAVIMIDPFSFITALESGDDPTLQRTLIK